MGIDTDSYRVHCRDRAAEFPTPLSRGAQKVFGPVRGNVRVGTQPQKGDQKIPRMLVDPDYTLDST